jgi:hypothetical protein
VDYIPLFKLKERYYNYQTKSLEHLERCNKDAMTPPPMKELQPCLKCNCGLLYDLHKLDYNQAPVLYGRYWKELLGKHEKLLDFSIIYNNLKKPTEPSYEEYLANEEKKKEAFRQEVLKIFGEDFKGL